MVYNANIPQATDEQSQSQIDILNNFITANASFGANHVDFATVANSGKHTIIEHVNQAAVPATAASVVKVFTRIPVVPFGPMLTVRGQNNDVPSAVNEIHGQIIGVANPSKIDILDFTGLTEAHFTVWMSDVIPAGRYLTHGHGWWDGVKFWFDAVSTIAYPLLDTGSAAPQLAINHNRPAAYLSSTYYSIQFHRLA